MINDNKKGIEYVIELQKDVICTRKSENLKNSDIL